MKTTINGEGRAVKVSWGRLLRRFFALFLATVGLWLLLMGAGAGAVDRAAGSLSSSAAFVQAALTAELGPALGDAPLAVQLLAGESALLAANPPKVSSSPIPQATPEPSPTPSAQELPQAQPAPDRDDVTEELPEPSTRQETVVERTLVPTSSQGYVTGAGLYLYNRAQAPDLDLAAELAMPLTFALAPAEEGPQILIVHTHATEAYFPDGEDTYTESDYSRTLAEEQNMLRVGDEMERVFTELGLSVLHDRSLHDYPSYTASYDNSRKSVAEYLKQYPTIRLVLDVHRDALVGTDGSIYKTCTTIDGVKAAQVMLVVGTDMGGGGHAGWRDNLALACKLQRSLDSLFPTLARPMTLRKLGYNQDLSPGMLLVEVGSHGNTLQEALAGARLFARAAGSVFLGLEETG